jgi:flagellar basal-body rod protein FlgG
MERGLYIAASGMLAELVRQDQIANDLANASTPGYKADRSAQRAFAELILTDRSAPGRTIGSLGLGAEIAETVTRYDQGELKETGETLDVGLSGPGFLSVQTADGVRYTRGGQLALDAQGRIMTVDGLLLLGANGQTITAGAREGLSISEDGTVRRDATVVGRLAVSMLDRPAKQGNSLYTGQPRAAGANDAPTTVNQGFIEGSGVNPARAMIEMIASLRAFEAAQRVIRGIDDTLQRAVNATSQGGV